ncbi:hypothetical protein COB55_03965 [Candidatus Wolfebacteria bacterium]|nr:MAG: hypothetical protein COB55_03965 [Candidatus Wolfebacteria bacterium]
MNSFKFIKYLRNFKNNWNTVALWWIVYGEKDKIQENHRICNIKFKKSHIMIINVGLIKKWGELLGKKNIQGINLKNI